MKKVFLLIALFFLALAACDKPNVQNKSYPEKLVGKWYYSQQFYSIGGPLIYTSTENLHQWINFKSDGGFSSNLPQFKNVVSYEVLDSVKIRFNSPATSSSERFFVQIDTQTQTLALSSADNICIEGCGMKFKRD